eukprot:scaffold623933_cov46-Prasinocladus_malaysianus.AAC.1
MMIRFHSPPNSDLLSGHVLSYVSVAGAKRQAVSFPRGDPETNMEDPKRFAKPCRGWQLRVFGIGNILKGCAGAAVALEGEILWKGFMVFMDCTACGPVPASPLVSVTQVHVSTVDSRQAIDP